MSKSQFKTRQNQRQELPMDTEGSVRSAIDTRPHISREVFTCFQCSPTEIQEAVAIILVLTLVFEILKFTLHAHLFRFALVISFRKAAPSNGFKSSKAHSRSSDTLCFEKGILAIATK